MWKPWGRKRERSFHARMPHTATPCKLVKQPPLSAKVALGKYMHKVVKQEFAGEATEDFWAGIQNDTGKPHPWLLDVYENLDKLDDKRKQLNLGMAMHATRIRIGVSKTRCLGQRAKGAGRKNYLLPIWIGLSTGSCDSARTGASWISPTSSSNSLSGPTSSQIS